MLPKHHVIYGIIIALLLGFLVPTIGVIGVLIIILSSVFIDVDHYIYYIFRKKDISLKKAFHWCHAIGIKYKAMSPKKRKKTFIPIFFLHGIESIIVLFLLTRISELFLFVLIGFIIHLFLDFINFTYHNIRFNRFSIIYEFIRSKNLIHIENVK